MQPTPFTDDTLRDAFFAALDGASGLPEGVSLVGSGPFYRLDLARFLGDRGIGVEPASGRTRVLVLGRENWSADTLGKLVDERSGRRLRTYSQEMFLAFAATGRDPFRQGREVVERYGRGHPALQHLTTLGFDWPTTLVFQGSGELEDGDGRDVSPLRRLGYRVGEDAPSARTRRQLLRIAFTSPLPQVGSPQYMEKWGRPGSEQRLRRIALQVASPGRDAGAGSGRGAGGRPGGDPGGGAGEADGREAREGPAAARRQRRDDLAWLEAEFHQGRFDFTWPSVEG